MTGNEIPALVGSRELLGALLAYLPTNYALSVNARFAAEVLLNIYAPDLKPDLTRETHDQRRKRLDDLADTLKAAVRARRQHETD